MSRASAWRAISRGRHPRGVLIRTDAAAATGANNGQVWDDLTARLEELLRPSGPPPRLSRRGQLFDIAFALVLAALGVNYVLEVPAGNNDLPAGTTTFFIVVTLAGCALVSQRRRFPLIVLALVAALTLPLVAYLPRVTYYSCVIAAYSAIAYSRHRLAATTSGAVLIALAWLFTRDGMPTIPQQYVGSLVAVIAVLGALALRMWRSRAEEGRDRLAAAERQREAELRRAVESERARIARELHDVVTHNVSVMVIQAGAARRTLDADPEQSREALLAVEGAGRSAMADLRHVMGLLAGDTGALDAGDLTPQPGIEQVKALVSRVEETGTPVEFTVTGTPRPLPAGESLAAYRVVQEALTNAVKHAAGSAASVLVHYCDDELRIEVTDTGGRSSGAGGSGRGLLGLHERLAVYGGKLWAGPAPTGDGYRVVATIPLASR